MKVHVLLLATLAIIIISAVNADRRPHKNETAPAPHGNKKPRPGPEGPRNASELHRQHPKPRRNKSKENANEADASNVRLAGRQGANPNRKNAAEGERRPQEKKRRPKPADPSDGVLDAEANRARPRPPRSANDSNIAPPLAAAPVVQDSPGLKKNPQKKGANDAGKKNKTMKSPNKKKGQGKNKTTKLPKLRKAPKKAHGEGEALHPIGVQPMVAAPAAAPAAAVPAPIVLATGQEAAAGAPVG